MTFPVYRIAASSKCNFFSEFVLLIQPGGEAQPHVSTTSCCFRILDYLVEYCMMFKCSSRAPEIVWGE